MCWRSSLLNENASGGAEPWPGSERPTDGLTPPARPINVRAPKPSPATAAPHREQVQRCIETIACAIQQEQAQQPQGIPRSPLGEAPSPLLALRPCKRGPFPPPDFLPDHVRVELLVPRAVEGVGDVQPLAIQAELHLTRATVHPLALEAQQRAGMSGPLSLSRQAKAEAAEQRSRAQWLPPLLTQLTLITKGSGWHFSSSSLHTVTGPPLRMLPPTNTWKQGSGRCVACLVTTTRY